MTGFAISYDSAVYRPCQIRLWDLEQCPPPLLGNACQPASIKCHRCRSNLHCQCCHWITQPVPVCFQENLKKSLLWSSFWIACCMADRCTNPMPQRCWCSGKHRRGLSHASHRRLLTLTDKCVWSEIEEHGDVKFICYIYMLQVCRIAFSPWCTLVPHGPVSYCLTLSRSLAALHYISVPGSQTPVPHL